MNPECIRPDCWRLLLVAPLLAAVACGGGGSAEGGDAALAELRGNIETDGSSTVYPITEAMAEEFGRETRNNVRVTVAQSGTGGGFKRFCAGETHISNASRAITDSERQLCSRNGVEYAEVRVALDGLAVLANPRNDFLECITVDELRRIWQPASRVRRWSDVRPDWPNRPIKLYGPGTNSGTFDYFTEAVMGEARASRPDYTASEDDNVLVQGVEGDLDALGYFGLAYYQENQSRLKLIAVDSGDGCVTPDLDTVRGGRYSPLSRPLFIYVNREALGRPEVAEFARFYVRTAPEIVPEVGYIPLEEAAYQTEAAKLEQGGSAS